MARPDLPGLLADVAAGDEIALTDLVRAFDGDLVRLAFVVTGDRELAEDAAQTTWERLWKNPPRLRRPDQLRSWLLTVAANEARQRARRKRRGAVLERTMAPGTDIDPGNDVAVLDLKVALATLSASQRELLALRFVLEMPSAEVASHLGVSPEAVRTRVHRAVNQLREELRRE